MPYDQDTYGFYSYYKRSTSKFYDPVVVSGPPELIYFLDEFAYTER
jgi:hypothetical protein